MTRHFSLQIPAGIEKAMLLAECGWLEGGFHDVEPASVTSRSGVTWEGGLVEQG
jgi:hypothetical protein